MPFLQENDIPGPVGREPALEPIAICGMSCRTPGKVTSPSALWQMLLEKAAGNTTKVPESRFNIDAHFHENMDRPGSFNVPGGYFLDGPPEQFDPTFFNMTPVEAMWLDPQQRRMLEVCYEAIESAGMTLDSVRALFHELDEWSNTGVFAASFTADYQQMAFKDHDFRHNYAATGVDTGIISARIGNTFDLRGPNSLINTACSSSVYAVHNACNSLRARDCDSALVGGVNMIVTVDQHMNTAKLGIMSPTSFCHTFDSSANGYGRAEGAGALFLKRFDDAVRDGDTIRAVIRSSAVNSNGKVPGYGITFPNVDGQEQVIRQAYRKAGLNPDDTAVFEVHGTGTPVGDPIEVRAVSRAMNDTRSKAKPLLLTAIKPNIGHSEAASGIFAIIKAALMVETGLLPGIAGLKTINPNITEAEWNVKINKDLSQWPSGFDSRRASLSSFGYGGTNAHVIIENVEALVPGYRRGAAKEKADYDHSSTRPLLVTMSAHDKTTLGRNIEAYSKVVDQFYLKDYAHTMNTRRTAFQQRAFAVASEPTAAQDLTLGNFKFGSSSNSIKGLAFIFTGQGAQWASVGKEAINTFPVFRETVRKLDQVLRRLRDPPDFTLVEQLAAPGETSRINDPDVAQSTLAAVQIAVVDLLASWGVLPKATIGHSSGEVGAAYAAGLVSAPEAIVAAYYRGLTLVRYAQKGGSMLAVGKGADDLEPYRGRLTQDIVVACENSPNSVTLSGPAEAIRKAGDMFAAENIFARELRTGMAYHSPFMRPAAEAMARLISEALEELDGLDRQWRYPERIMISTVTNKRLRKADVNSTYWTSNLVSPVLFNTGVQALLDDESLGSINGFLEVGPHSALAGPLKQIYQHKEVSSFTYIPSIVRNDGNAALSLLRTAGELHLASYPVDLVQVNRLGPAYRHDTTMGHSKPRYTQPMSLVDLPPYQWNYEKVFWTEPRASAEYRQLKHPRHDLLGRRILGLSDRNIAWRNVLRIKDIPWLVDHKLGDSVMFPAAGHLAVAIEALRQYCEISNVEIVGATVRDLELKTALIIPETDGGIEIQVRLTEQSCGPENIPFFTFAVESWSNGWVVHSTGTIEPNSTSSAAPSADHPVDTDALTQRHSGKRWNDSFRRVGFEYGRAFATLDKIRTHGKYHHQAAGSIPIAVESGLMQGESRYMVHPSTVDGLLQLVIIAIHAGLYQEMPWGVIPVRFDEVTIRLPAKAAGTMGQAISWLPEPKEHARRFISNAKLISSEGDVLVDIKGLHTQSYDAALPPLDESALKPMPYTGVVWRPDPTLNSPSSLVSRGSKAIDAVFKLLESLNHKRSLASVLVLDSQGIVEEKRLQVTAPMATITAIGVKDASDDIRLRRLALSDGVSEVFILGLEKQDVAIFGQAETAQLIQEGLVSDIQALLGENSNLVLLVEKHDSAKTREAVGNCGLASEVVSFADFDLVCHLSSHKTNKGQDEINGDGKIVNGNENSVRESQVDLVYSPRHSASPEGLTTALVALGINVHIRTLEEASTNSTNQIVLYNPHGNLLSHTEQDTFESLKTVISSGTSVLWLTSGVNQGQCTSAAMVSGFLRVVREEQKMARVLVLDYDKTENFETIAHTVASVLDDAGGKEVPETEFWLHDRVCHISRVLPNEDINNRMIGERGEIKQLMLPRGELLRGFPEAGEIVFRRSEDFDVTWLSAGDVEIQVTHVLDFRKQDLQASPESPRLIAGIVTQVGRDVKSDLTGARVVTYTLTPYNTLVRVPEDIVVRFNPSKYNGLLAGLSRAIHALYTATASLTGKRVLLLSPSSSLAKSVSLLAEAYGFEVFTSSSPSTVIRTRDFIQNSGPSLIVLAEVLSSLGEEIWRDLPSGASFVLVSSAKDPSQKALDSRPFLRGARFVAAGLEIDLKTNAASIRSSIESAITVAERHGDEGEDEAQTLTVNSLTDASSAPEETSILRFGYGSDTIKVLPSAHRLRFSSEDVYLLVGCLGGLGRSLTSWMMDHGARRFAFVSRSGDDKPEAARLVRDIIDAGALPQIFRGDVANVTDMKSVVQAITKDRRIRGVVHAAMVLNDSMLPNMTVDKWKGTLSPKVDGALALTEALRDHNETLDFFVMTSSISATAGQPGQANYAAANAFLDNIALTRRLAGLPATTLVLPMVLGVGVVAESDNLEGQISRRGLYGADEREMLRGFAAAMSQPRPLPSTPSAFDHAHSAIIMGLEPARLGVSLAAAADDDSSDLSWFEEDARFSGLQAWVRAASGSLGSKDAATNAGAFIPQLYAIANKEGYARALDITCEHIVQKCSAILLIPIDSFELDGKSVGAHGLDSMIGVELRNWLFKELRLNIPFQELLATTMTLRGLSELVLKGLDILPGLTLGEVEEEQRRARSGIKD
ncbi:Lovastatin diketide synthase LovF [Cytospora mali]|uniref:Lovastatin diketide synthase LovF n=1 Tax=Cytospora mali TaxID=578113 RepID=A0A194VBT7_CYTMA|nr:Lovastatin diketide synthase LovF [Valsa mali var. pyri (nom. inval.)]